MRRRYGDHPQRVVVPLGEGAWSNLLEPGDDSLAVSGAGGIEVAPLWGLVLARA